VSVFCNLAASVTASRLPECFHEADEETLPGFGQHWFINIGRELATSAAIIRSLLFEDPSPTKNAGGRGVCVGGKLARYSCQTGGKLEEDPDFSLRRVTFR
jgi:hypothetical protein